MTTQRIFQREVPMIFAPLEKKARHKGAKGGRGSGKSYFFADGIIQALIVDPNKSAACMREVQKSIAKSSKKLIEERIRYYGVQDYFEILQTEIRSTRGKGEIIFNGLQDHTADSIKSLEGFDICWVEEAQSISKYSLDLLLPTFRKDGSELWFSWNPKFPTDAVEKLFTDKDNAVLVHANYNDNPFCTQIIIDEAEEMRRKDYESYSHIYLGDFVTRSDAQIFAGKFEVRAFDTMNLGEPLHGLDFGFSQDPTAGVRLYIKDNVLYIAREAGKIGLELDDTAQYLKDRIPNIDKYALPCDSARPESISHLKRHGLPRAYSVDKWAGSVEDGVEFIKTFDNIVIHTRCTETASEFLMYSYKVDKRTDDVLPKIEDKYNHYIDAIRYALGKLIKRAGGTNSFKVKI